MKIKLGVTDANGANQDITLSYDSTTTVGETAQTLARSRMFAGSYLDDFVASRSGQVTLLGSALPGMDERLFDPGVPLGTSGLKSGWQVTVVPEFGALAPRMCPLAGTVEVLSGTQAGARFSLVAGFNTIGRDPQSRIVIDDRSVSRRHAVIEIDHALLLRDLGSANGLEVNGQLVCQMLIESLTEVTIGEVRIRITPLDAPRDFPSKLAQLRRHTRAPRVDPSFPVSERELPQPPQTVKPHRIPLLAMLIPMMMGGVLFAVTRSPMSLLMVAFTPMMMIGTWVDNFTSGRRRLRRELRLFRATLARERQDLLELRAQEVAMRAQETPSQNDISEGILDRGRLLWARRPEHRSFLSLRLGDGTLQSRTRIKLPSRGDAPSDEWEALRSLQREFDEISCVPVLERLDSCGSIGISGDSHTAEGLMRSLILQLTGLHSPAELLLTAFLGTRHEHQEWQWLKWLPHVSPPTSPLAAWQLADNARSSATLLNALETLVDQRRGRVAQSLRSHLEPRDASDTGASGAVDTPPLIPAVIVLVLDNEIDEILRSRLIALAEEGPDCGIHLIWAAPGIAQVPAACRTYIEVEDSRPGGVAGFVRLAQRIELSRVECMDSAEAEVLARSMASVEDAASRAHDESDLPRSVHLRQLHGVDLLGGAGPILQAWQASGSVVSTWTEGEDREPVSLAAVVGQGTDGPVEIDLRLQGPHALVGGTTGAGKSEFLQTWIMSLAANVSPDRLAFLLVDYKGGAAFAECVRLPHTVGLVTDLSPPLVRRALTSLRAELRYREALLSAHGVKDLITMERRGDAQAPPNLIIVIDEFAALASDIPEFVDGVIDIAQRGRSLGLHLIMATQRPAGVIKENLRANTNLRVALRMADETDSVDVIGERDAALFDAETPGRGAMKCGSGRTLHFQTGYLGGHFAEATAAAKVEVKDLGLVEGDAWDIPVGGTGSLRRSRRRAVKRDIERLLEGVIAAAKQGEFTLPRKPWLDPMPAAISLTEVQAMPVQRGKSESEVTSARPVLIGVRDRPDAQLQEVVGIDFDEVGNLAVFGAGGTGKSSALLLLAASISEHADSDPVQLYVIDAAGGGLDPLRALPTVGAVAPMSDAELVSRMLQHLQSVVQERGSRFAVARANNLSAYRQTRGHTEPRVLLLIDGFSAFRQAAEMPGVRETPMQQLASIMQVGRSVGVHVVLTADRAGALPAALTASVQQQLVLRLASANDYAFFDVPADTLESAPPGRGVFAGQTDEVQLGLLAGAPDLATQSSALAQLGTRLEEQRVMPAPVIRKTPDRVELGELAIAVDGLPVFAIETQRFEPMSMPASGLAVISGPAGSGLSTAALTCVSGVKRWAEVNHERVERILLSLAPRRSGGLAGRAEWDRVAQGEDEVVALARELNDALADTSSVKSVRSRSLIGTTGEPPDRSRVEHGGEAAVTPDLRVPQAGRRIAIVVERPTEAEGTAALPELVALAKVARRAEALVIFECEQGAASGVWELLLALRQSRWGVALQPDEGDSGSPFRESFGRVKRADFPPGRGFVVEGGRITPIHVALPPVRYPG